MKKVVVLFLIIFSCQCSAHCCWIFIYISVFNSLSNWCLSCRTSTEQRSGPMDRFGSKQSKNIKEKRDVSTQSEKKETKDASTQYESIRQAGETSSAATQQRVNQNHIVAEGFSQFRRQQRITSYPPSSNSSLPSYQEYDRRCQNQPYRQGYSGENCFNDRNLGSAPRFTTTNQTFRPNVRAGITNSRSANNHNNQQFMCRPQPSYPFYPQYYRLNRFDGARFYGPTQFSWPISSSAYNHSRSIYNQQSRCMPKCSYKVSAV